MKIYLNGALGGSGSFGGGTGSTTPDKNLAIGARSYDSIMTAFYGGDLDDMRIYDRALTAEEIEELYQEEAGPVAHWKFDEGEGSVAYDSAGDNDGNLVNGPVWTTGILDGALSFDGFDDYVEVPDDATLRFSQHDTFSMSYWAMPMGSGNMNVVGKYRGGGQHGIFGYRTGWSSTPSYFYFLAEKSYTGWDTVPTQDESAPAGHWYYVTCVYDNKSMNIYLNGELSGSGAFTYDTGGTTPDNSLTIGAKYWDFTIDTFFNGTVDDVRIYDRALSVDEVQQLYEEGEPPPPSVFYVDGVNGSDLNDGLTLETAFATIQRGIDEANDSNTVLVYPAVYQEEINFDGKAITVQGVTTAAGAAVLEAPPPMDFAVSMYLDEGPNSILKHFVIRNSDMAFFLAGSSPTLAHLIIVDNEFGIGAYAGADPDISNCILYNNTDGDLFQCEARYSWVEEDVNEANEPNTPMFADAAGGDYHLLSERGRYWPAMDVWVLDEITSPCVDGGDPNHNPSGERMPNGGRVNMGVYGGTGYASMSEWPIREDNNRDGVVNWVDVAMLADRWLEKLGWAE
jgi:hypothetical protein